MILGEGFNSSCIHPSSVDDPRDPATFSFPALLHHHCDAHRAGARWAEATRKIARGKVAPSTFRVVPTLLTFCRQIPHAQITNMLSARSGRVSTDGWVLPRFPGANAQARARRSHWPVATLRVIALNSHQLQQFRASNTLRPSAVVPRVRAFLKLW